MCLHVSKLLVQLFLLTISILFLHSLSQAATYEVGAGKAYGKINDVPWESLQAGDTVLIYWRAAAYKEKWIINRQGQPNAPITVRGVPGPNGELPIIDGNGATTRMALNFWNESRGLIKIGGSSIPADTMPQYIVIENLDVRSARSPYTFISSKGNVENYADNAAAILLEKGDNLTIRNCVLSDSGNGLFASSSDTVLSRNVLVDGCYIHSNGIVNSPYQHNIYTEAQGITFQNNRLGPLRAGAQGSNLKDRSAGLIVRYNWIEGGNREMDLVDATGCAVILGDPRYHEAFVYGNILIEPDGDGNRQIVHYGGDSANTADYRKGTLYFYENTVVSKRTDRTTYFRLSTNDERCDARNNIFYTVAGGDTQSFLDNTGTVQLSHNWIKPGWVVSFNNPPAGGVVNDGTSILGTSPSFVNEAGQDYRLAPGSAAINAGGALSPTVMVAHDVTRQYRKHQASEARAKDQTLDLGAYEQGSVASPTPTPAPLTLTTTALPNGTSGVAYTATLAASGGTSPYSWKLAAGALPAGLSLNYQTGMISGMTTSSGSTTFTVQLTDAQPTPSVVTKLFTMVINAGNPPAPTSLQISTTALVNGRVGVSYAQPLAVSGGRGSYYWAVVAGYLPAGVTLNSSTGVISGIPQQAGTKGIAIRVWDLQSGLQTTRDFSLTIAP